MKKIVGLTIALLTITLPIFAKEKCGTEILKSIMGLELHADMQQVTKKLMDEGWEVRAEYQYLDEKKLLTQNEFGFAECWALPPATGFTFTVLSVTKITLQFVDEQLAYIKLDLEDEDCITSFWDFTKKKNRIEEVREAYYKKYAFSEYTKDYWSPHTEPSYMSPLGGNYQLIFEEGSSTGVITFKDSILCSKPEKREKEKLQSQINKGI